MFARIKHLLEKPEDNLQPLRHRLAHSSFVDGVVV